MKSWAWFMAVLLPVAAQASGEHGVTEGPITSLSQLGSIAHLAQAPSLRPFDIKHWQTEQGTDVLFVRATELPMLDVRVIFDAGSARDGALPGVASTAAGMLDEGSATRDAGRIALEFERIGAEFRSSSARDMAVVELRTLSDASRLNDAVNQFIDVVAHPAFSDADYARVHGQANVGQQQKQQSPAALASIAFYKELYGKHPYSTPPTGTLDSIGRIRPQDLRDFHHRYYVAHNAVIAMVGDVTEEQARKISNDITSALPSGDRAPTLPEVSALAKAKAVHQEFASQQTHILMGQKGIRRDDPDYYALYVGNEILGGGGFTSMLTLEIREKRGLSYGVNSSLVPMNAEGPFLISMQTRNDQADQAILLAREVLRNFVKDGPSEQQVQETIDSVVGGYPLGLSSNYSIIGNLATMAFYRLPGDFLEKFPDRVRQVTPQSVRDAFHRHINPDDLLVVTVGQQAASRDEKAR